MSAWLEEELRTITATDDKHIAPSYGLGARAGESLAVSSDLARRRYAPHDAR